MNDLSPPIHADVNRDPVKLFLYGLLVGAFVLDLMVNRAVCEDGPTLLMDGTAPGLGVWVLERGPYLMGLACFLLLSGLATLYWNRRLLLRTWLALLLIGLIVLQFGMMTAGYVSAELALSDPYLNGEYTASAP